VTVATDNRDLQNRRNRLGLSQQDIADIFCGFDPANEEERGKGFSFSNVSRFETGERDTMPAPRRGVPRLVREDYEDLLDRLERESSRGAK